MSSPFITVLVQFIFCMSEDTFRTLYIKITRLDTPILLVNRPICQIPPLACIAAIAKYNSSHTSLRSLVTSANTRAFAVSASDSLLVVLIHEHSSHSLDPCLFFGSVRSSGVAHVSSSPKHFKVWFVTS